MFFLFSTHVTLFNVFCHLKPLLYHHSELKYFLGDLHVFEYPTCFPIFWAKLRKYFPALIYFRSNFSAFLNVCRKGKLDLYSIKHLPLSTAAAGFMQYSDIYNLLFLFSFLSFSVFHISDSLSN